jgi:hypothetical protein
MLDVKQVDLDRLVQALEDHAHGGDWWLDPRSGEVSLRDEPLPDGAVLIPPLGAHELDQEVREVVSRIVDGEPRELIESAAAGREAFEERLRQFPLLEEAWPWAHTARMRRRALEWLAGHGLVAREAVLADQIALRALEWGAFQKAGELAALIRLLRGRELRAVLEIGTARGGTLYVWCRLADPDAAIFSVDLPGGRFGGVEDSEIPKLRSLAKRGQTLHLVRSNSHDPSTESEVAALIEGQRIDFLMIDGDHSLEGVRQDFELYSPLVRPGGLIAFHDILPHPSVPECEVELLWRELKEHHRHVEFLEPEDDRGWGQWGGIGVLFW